MFSVFYEILAMLTKIYKEQIRSQQGMADLISFKIDQVIKEQKTIEELLEKILDGQSRIPSKIIFSFNGTRMDTMAQMKDSQVAVIAISEVDDAKGFKIDGAALDAGAIWSLDDASMGALVVAADGQSASFAPAKPGLAHVILSGSIGGVAIIGTSEDIVVVAGDAASIKLSVAVQ